MLATPTLFVIGAGASAELGFPVGAGLRDRISDILDLRFQGIEFDGPDRDFAAYLSDRCIEINVPQHDLWQAARSVSRTLPLVSSIDAYLDTHLEHPLRSTCAKLAIARVISVAENASDLACDNDRDAREFDFRPFRDTWYQRLWSVLQAGVTTRDAQRAFNNLKIVTFNYDRNIERFLQFAYSHFLDVPLDVAMQHVHQLGIIHVYGSLGALEPRPDTSKSYRRTAYTIDLAIAASGIATFTESVNSETITQIHDAVWASQRIIFLGFSYGAANMDLFAQSVGGIEIQREVYGTTYRMYSEAKDHARNRLYSIFSRSYSLVHLQDDQAFNLFDRYAGVI